MSLRVHVHIAHVCQILTDAPQTSSRHILSEKLCISSDGICLSVYTARTHSW